MSRNVLFGVLTLFVIVGNVSAAEPEVQTKEKITMAAMQANKKAVVAQNIVLTPEQEKVFWPLYDDYQIELNKLNADRIALINKFAINYNVMSDELATELLDRTLDLDKKRLNLKKELIDRFGKKFPPRVVARYFQIENKIDAAMLAEAAGQIPLMK